MMSTDDHQETGRCFICGYDNPHGLHEHHIVPQAFGGSDEPENLVWLCGSCHQAIHKLYTRDFFQRLGGKEEAASTFSMDTDGTHVPPNQSIDRDLPQSSPHLTIEEFTFNLSLEDIDGYLHHWEDLSEWDPAAMRTREWMKDHTDYIVEKLHVHLDAAREAIESESEIRSYLIPPDNPRQHPRLKIVGEEEDSEWESSFQRYHCGYCHSVFTEHEQANLARHLRMRHGVENPFEVVRSRAHPLSEMFGSSHEKEFVDNAKTRSLDSQNILSDEEARRLNRPQKLNDSKSAPEQIQDSEEEGT